MVVGLRVFRGGSVENINGNICQVLCYTVWWFCGADFGIGARWIGVIEQDIPDCGDNNRGLEFSQILGYLTKMLRYLVQKFLTGVFPPPRLRDPMGDAVLKRNLPDAIRNHD